MTCREFATKIEDVTLAELGSTADVELLAHGRGCAACTAWLQQRHAMAGAMQVLRSSTAAMQAPVQVEHEVLRAFRQSSPQNRLGVAACRSLWPRLSFLRCRLCRSSRVLAIYRSGLVVLQVRAPAFCAQRRQPSSPVSPALEA